MFLIIAIVLALANIIILPLSDGLFNTSRFVAKILAPVGSEEIDFTKQLMKVSQAALMEGWLSNIPFISSILFYLSIITGFLYSWWGGILIYFITIILGALTKILWTRTISYYLVLIYHKMVNRIADYKVKNDIERLEASESVCKDLEQILLIYHDARVKPPTKKQLNEIPYGDLYYWYSNPK